MNKIKKIPMRKCVVTGERFEKKALLRVVKTPEGVVIVDPSGKANGRGAYVCKNTEVILKAQKTKILERHLETVIPNEVYTVLLSLVSHE
ncbi:MAG: YlxR family protein [Candidatus Izemoplasmatales bacterium]|nr:YlxR family protein [Candidatus Izemoplasmatales bacterium]